MESKKEVQVFLELTQLYAQALDGARAFKREPADAQKYVKECDKQVYEALKAIIKIIEADCLS